MSERSGLLTLADRLERLIHGNQALSAQRTGRTVTELLTVSEPEVLEPEGPVVRMAVPPEPGTLRVLIAEPDQLQREVLAHLVEHAGYAADCVESPEEALPAIQNRAYAAFLLDCDSNEMRGMETAVAVRLMTTAAGKTPIIAITSSGGEEQRRQRKAAGIDNYLARPVLRENLETVLSRLAPGKTESLARFLALDRNRLLELEGAAGDHPELFCRWVQMFLARAPRHLDEMRAAQEDGNIFNLADAARKLRSLSGQVGALRVQEICGIIVALCGTGSIAGAESLVPETALALDRATRELHFLEAESRAGRRLSGRSPVRSSPVPRRSNDVLVVVDDSLIARFLVSGLSAAGFSVTHVMGGRSGINTILGRQFGAVILDLDVSEVDGFSVLSEIRISPQRELPVIVVSSRHQEQDVVRAFELGADDYVTIPFNPLEVVVRLRRLLRQGAVTS